VGVGGRFRGRPGIGGLEPRPDGRVGDAVLLEDGEGGVRFDGLWDRRAARDHAVVVPDDVADDEADDGRRGGRGGEAAALDLRAGPSDDVDRVDRRPGREEPVRHPREVGRRQVAGRGAEQCAAAAGDRRQHERGLVGRSRPLEDGLGTGDAPGAGRGMLAESDRHAVRVRGVSVGDDDPAGRVPVE